MTDRVSDRPWYRLYIDGTRLMAITDCRRRARRICTALGYPLDRMTLVECSHSTAHRHFRRANGTSDIAAVRKKIQEAMISRLRW